MPESVGLTEKGSETDGHGRGDGAFAVDDLVDGTGGNTDGSCHRVLGDAHGFEVFFQEDFTGGDVNGSRGWRRFSGRCQSNGR